MKKALTIWMKAMAMKKKNIALNLGCLEVLQSKLNKNTKEVRLKRPRIEILIYQFHHEDLKFNKIKKGLIRKNGSTTKRKKITPTRHDQYSPMTKVAPTVHHDHFPSAPTMDIEQHLLTMSEKLMEKVTYQIDNKIKELTAKKEVKKGKNRAKVRKQIDDTDEKRNLW